MHIYIKVAPPYFIKMRITSIVFGLIAFAWALCVEVCAFSTTPSISSRTTWPMRHRSYVESATVGSSNSFGGSRSTKCSRNKSAKEEAELETIRNELIQKYIKLGHSEAYAKKEVDFFLEDSERSAQYVEMRRIAMARGNDLGIESWIQFGVAFILGWFISWSVNYLPSFQVRCKLVTLHKSVFCLLEL